MSKLFEQFLNNKNLNESRPETQVLRIFAQLKNALGIHHLEDISYDDVISCGQFCIVKESRFFDNEWIDVLEINYYNNSSKTDRKNWSNGGGTSAVNVPPAHVVQEVLDYIKNYK